MANRLQAATSPYLLQHADNPVDWWPWGPEAFAEARRRDVPVLISVGYAACHWCHVMAHESFEDPQVAALVNENVVSIKVDREERPDVDAVYMSATQAMTGQGGWPMTVFATPDGHPLYCGTYFPRPHFARLVQAIARAWASDREKLISDSERNVAILASQSSAVAGLGSPGGLSEASLSEAAQAAVTALDAAGGPAGGPGQAPKFPPSMTLEFLLRHAARAGDEAGTTGHLAREMAATTLGEMASGGMYDQLGGGFSRYSVDATWTVPHFEKMLYDNALLARVYTHWWRLSGSGLGRRIAEETCDFMLRELRTDAGGFAASLDADSLPGQVRVERDGGASSGMPDAPAPGGEPGGGEPGHPEEGAFYVWTPAELDEALEPHDAELAALAFTVTGTGTFEHGTSVLQRRSPVGPADGAERLNRIRGVLLEIREGRPRPGRDDKVVAAWNGLAIAALAEAGILFNRPDFVTAASQAAELLVSVHLMPPAAGAPAAAAPAATASPEAVAPAAASSSGSSSSGSPEAAASSAGIPASGESSAAASAGVGSARLVRTSRDGVAGTSAGQLEDYACVAAGLLTLFGVTGQAQWATVAASLLDSVLTEFPDQSGGFYDAPADGEKLIFRPADPLDGATPSGTFAAADALASYAALTGSARHREAAIAALGVLPAVAARHPRACGTGLAVAEALLAGPVEIAIVGSQRDPRTGDLLRAALHGAGGGSVLALGDGAAAAVPLLADRPLVGGAPTAYVCRGFTCLLPVTTPADLREELSAAMNPR
jgi:hypothetical protein